MSSETSLQKELNRKRIRDFTTLLNWIVVPCVLGGIWLVVRGF